MDAAVQLDAVVGDVEHIVAVEIHRGALVLRHRAGIAEGGVVNRVMEIGDVIVRHDMALAIDLHRIFGCQQRREFAVLLPEGITNPAGDAGGIVAAQEDIVGDVVILRFRPVFAHHAADIAGAAIDQGEAVGAGDVLDAQQEADIGVFDVDAVEIIVVGGQQVEEGVIAVAVEHHLAVARRLDDDGFVGRAAGGQVIGTVKRRPIGFHRLVEAAINEALVFIGAGMDQDNVARLDPRREDIVVVAFIGAFIIGGQQTDELVRLQRRFMAEGIDMIDVAAAGGSRHLAGAHGGVLH